jgi:catechol 2,3-dioxygenase-like lactoylglutathione lyase family enzyme
MEPTQKNARLIVKPLGRPLRRNVMIESKGWSHVGLATHDMKRTRDFYEGVLGFKAVRCDVVRVKEGGEVHHIFFDAGRGQLLAFMEPRGVPGVPAKLATDLNRTMPTGFHVYHFALEIGGQTELVAKRAELISKGVKVSPIVDHEWAKSIYFKDPNGFVIEYSFLTREFNEDDAKMQVRIEVSLSDPVPWIDFRDE